MALPLLFIGIAAATGAFGVGSTGKAVVDNSRAKKIVDIANKNVQDAASLLEQERSQVSDALNSLGQAKLDVLGSSINSFLGTFEKIKNVDFTASEGLEELKNLHIDKKDFQELKQLGNIAAEVAGGATTGLAGGALTAFGAVGAAQAFASASTGTAISTLSGVAAHNATLAFFGGGSLASGGLGMAGGAMVLGGLVAGPALMVMGIIVGANAQQKLNEALKNKAQADETVEALKAASSQCSAIRRRTYMFYTLLSHLDAYFVPLIWQMQDILKQEGDDYRQYRPESKKAVAMAASTACTIKAVLDTPILTAEGALTDASEKVTNEISGKLYQSA